MECVNTLSFIPTERNSRHLVPAGTLLVGEICEVCESYILVKADTKTFRINNDLIAVNMFNLKPTIGELLIFAALKYEHGTARGKKFISQVLNLFFPYDSTEDESKPEVTNAASNSWSIIEMNERGISYILKNKGVLFKQITEISGLRRATIVRKRKDDSDRYDQHQFADLINNTWSALKIVNFSLNYIELECQTSSLNVDPRKLRTFFSMLKKLYPDSNIEIHFVSPNGERNIQRPSHVTKN
jgi:hypothetical protein